MTHRIFTKIAKNLPIRLNESAKTTQRFQNLLVVDFEATCCDKTIIDPQEIIEFPCVVLSTEDWEVKDVFHEYIKPRYHNVTPFCTDLTGILQETVDSQPHFPEIFSRFSVWLKSGKYLEGEPRKSAFLTCGDWDFKVMLRKQCELDHIPVPEYFEEWIDLKKTFCSATKHFPRGLKHMTTQLNLPLEGRLHCGIDDSRNMVKIIKKLYRRHKINFDLNSSIHQKHNLGVIEPSELKQ